MNSHSVNIALTTLLIIGAACSSGDNGTNVSRASGSLENTTTSDLQGGDAILDSLTAQHPALTGIYWN